MRKYAEDLTGQRFERWAVIEYKYENEQGQAQWLCVCLICGKQQTIIGKNLRAGAECTECALKRHEAVGTVEYKAWANMIQRCTNSNRDNYRYYGGRGIKVCDKWLKFEGFFEDMGKCPEGLTLDRINNDGDYCKENCRWTTWKEQAKNKRRKAC